MKRQPKTALEIALDVYNSNGDASKLELDLTSCEAIRHATNALYNGQLDVFALNLHFERIELNKKPLIGQGKMFEIERYGVKKDKIKYDSGFGKLPPIGNGLNDKERLQWLSFISFLKNIKA